MPTPTTVIKHRETGAVLFESKLPLPLALTAAVHRGVDLAEADLREVDLAGGDHLGGDPLQVDDRLVGQAGDQP